MAAVVSFRTRLHGMLAEDARSPDNFRMRTLVGLVVTAGLLLGIYMFSLKRMPTTDRGTAPTQAISLTGVRMDLLHIAEAERMNVASNGRCASMDELISANAVSMARPGRDGYTYSVDCSGTAFSATATHPPAPEGSGIRFPTLMVDQNMEVREVQ
jgi:hypothetical protein